MRGVTNLDFMVLTMLSRGLQGLGFVSSAEAIIVSTTSHANVVRHSKVTTKPTLIIEALI